MTEEEIAKAAAGLERAAERLTTIRLKAPVTRFGWWVSVLLLSLLLALGSVLAFGVQVQIKLLRNKVDALTCLILTPATERFDITTATRCGLK